MKKDKLWTVRVLLKVLSPGEQQEYTHSIREWQYLNEGQALNKKQSLYRSIKKLDMKEYLSIACIPSDLHDE